MLGIDGIGLTVLLNIVRGVMRLYVSINYERILVLVKECGGPKMFSCGFWRCYPIMKSGFPTPLPSPIPHPPLLPLATNHHYHVEC